MPSVLVDDVVGPEVRADVSHLLAGNRALDLVIVPVVRWVPDEKHITLLAFDRRLPIDARAVADGGVGAPDLSVGQTFLFLAVGVVDAEGMAAPDPFSTTLPDTLVWPFRSSAAEALK